MDGLPAVSQAQINAMNKKAEQMFGNEVEQPEIQVHPMLQMPPLPQLQSNTPQQYMNAQIDNTQEIREEVVHIEQPVQELEEEEITPVKVETDRDRNLRFMREDLERERREKEMWQQRAMERQQPQYEDEDDEEDDDVEQFFKKNNLEEDSLVTARDLKELVIRDKERERRQLQLEKEYRSEISRMKVNSSLPDFDKVCSNENFTILRQLNPTLAQTIYNMPDSYEKKELAYSMVKQYGIYKVDTPQTVRGTDDKLQALKNVVKPRVTASVSPQQSESPLMRANAFANGRSKELDAIALQEMRMAKMQS